MCGAGAVFVVLFVVAAADPAHRVPADRLGLVVAAVFQIVPELCCAADRCRCRHRPEGLPSCSGGSFQPVELPS